MQIISAQKSAESAKSQTDESKVCLQQLQSGQQRNQLAMFRVQSEIASLGTRLAKDCNYLMNRQEGIDDLKLKWLVRKLAAARRKAKVDIYESRSKKCMFIQMVRYPV